VADEETSANISAPTKSFCLIFSPAVFGLRERYVSPKELSNRIVIWSALTCQRFGKRRLVVAICELEDGRDKSRLGKTAISRRTPQNNPLYKRSCSDMM
jgi:hypothetical protein